MQLSVNSFSYNNIEDAPHPIVLKKPDAVPFTLLHVHVNTESANKLPLLKSVEQTLNIWKDVMEARLRNSEALGLPEHKYKSDFLVSTAYQNLLESTDDNSKELISKKPNKNRHIMILSDTDGHIQAIATLKIKLACLEVDTLVSAPWNVPMTSEVHPDHKKLCIKGAGTTLMRQMYELAKCIGKKAVELRPIDSARSFYVEALKMVPDNNTTAVRFFVSTDHLPEKLDVPSGNLLNYTN